MLKRLSASALVRPLSRRPAQLSCLPSSSRFASTAEPTSLAEEVAEEDEPVNPFMPSSESEEDQGGRRRRRKGDDGVIHFKQWLATEGAEFKTPTRPRNWLGGNVPFPLNKSFKPPTPLSDTLRSSIFTMHVADPVNNTARHIASQFGLSIPRVEAILKLKYFEENLKKDGKQQLQTGYQAGMERVLGVEADTRSRKAALSALTAVDRQLAEVTALSRTETQAADLQSQDEGAEGIRARGRYTRMYWELLSDEHAQQDLGSIVPAQLEQGRRELREARQKLRNAKSMPSVLLGVPEARLKRALPPDEAAELQALPKAERAKTPRGRARSVVVPSGSSAPNRPTIEFTDIGGKFVDLDRINKKAKAAEKVRKLRERGEREERARKQAELEQAKSPERARSPKPVALIS